jgi:PAS domain S-box-containing protein
MSSSPTELHRLLDEVATILGTPGSPAKAASPPTAALECLGRFLGASGGMLLKAEDPSTLRLAAQYGEIWDEEELSSGFMDITYGALFREQRPTLVRPGEAGFPGSVIGSPLSFGDRHVGGIFLLRDADAPAFTEDDRNVLQLACVSIAVQLDTSDVARRNSARRAELEAVHASMVDGLMVVDRRGYISSFNEAFKRMSAIEAYELYGHRWIHLLEARPSPTIDSAEVLEGFLDALLTGEPYGTTGCPAWLKQPDGTKMAVTVGLTAIEEDGRVTGGVLNIRDATVETHLERLKDDFIATVSHELKTPLTTISGFVELLRNHDLPRTEQTPLFDLILDECRRLGRMITDLLDLSKIQSGLLTLHVERFNVSKLVDQATQPFKMRHQDTHQFRIEVSPPNGTMLADRDRVLQVLVNLIGNAVKYSPAGGLVAIRAQKVKAEWEFSVTDQGMGIPEAALPRLFGRFFRVNEQQSTGSGLGLFITKNLVERHGGRIWVQSQDGVGSTFSFRLPTITPDDPNAERAVPNAEAARKGRAEL